MHVEQSSIISRLGRTSSVRQDQRYPCGPPGSPISQSSQDTHTRSTSKRRIVTAFTASALPLDSATSAESEAVPVHVAPVVAAVPADPATLAISPQKAVLEYNLEDIFLSTVAKPFPRTDLPKVGDRIVTTSQLAYCLHLLREASLSSSSLAVGHLNLVVFNAAERAWITTMDENPETQAHLDWLAAEMTSEFIHLKHRETASVSEVVMLGPVLGRSDYRRLLSFLIETFERTSLLDVDLLQGLVQLLQSATPEYLETDDL
ncbi:hypothetical protein EC968_005141, partial [Mortierella alpina]